MKSLLKVIVLAAIYLFSGTPLHAQPDGVKFGKISKDELTMTSYENDPDAVAVVLYDFGNTYFTFNKTQGRFQTVYERETRIKILRKEGYEYANVSIPYYKSSAGDELITGIKASTYNVENGKEDEIKMEKSIILEEKLNKYWNLVKFTLPNVREGSIIEYKYQITSDFIFSPPKWEFQWDIPVAWSEYKFAAPEYYRYVQIGQGYDPYEIAEKDVQNKTLSFLNTYDASGTQYTVQKRTTSSTASYSEETFRWVQKDLAALKEEPYSPARSDLISKIEFQLSSVNFPGQITENIIPNWEKLARELYQDEDFGRFLNKGSRVQDIIASETAGLTSDKEKINALHDYVKNNFRWNDIHQIYASQTINDLLKARTGNSADLNLLMVLLLREAGLEAHPVIISTRDHGRINQAYPLLSKFNSVITYVNTGDQKFTMDATAPMLSADMVAYQDLNGDGLLVSEDGYAWVLPGGDFKETSYNKITATLQDGALACDIISMHKGYGAAKMRNDLKSKGEKETAKSFLQNHLNEVEVSQSSFENKDDPNASLKCNFACTSTTFVEDVGEMMYINPMMGFGISENPFNNPERTFPIDFAHLSDDIYHFTLIIPEGYTLVESPESIRMSLEGGSFQFEYIITVEGEKVGLNYRLRRNQVDFLPEDYPKLRGLFEEITKYCNNQIVLKKA